MKFKWFLPLFYFVFGMLVSFIETMVFRLMGSVSILTRVNVNHFNLWMYRIIPFLLLGIFVLPVFKEAGKKTPKYFLLVYSIILFVAISYFWTVSTQWK